MALFRNPLQMNRLKLFELTGRNQLDFGSPGIQADPGSGPDPDPGRDMPDIDRGFGHERPGDDRDFGRRPWSDENNPFLIKDDEEETGPIPGHPRLQGTRALRAMSAIGFGGFPRPKPVSAISFGKV